MSPVQNSDTALWLADWRITPQNFVAVIAEPPGAWLGVVCPHQPDEPSDQEDAEDLERRFVAGELHDLTPYSEYRARRSGTTE